ncbi:hypothetical protein ACFT7S_17000 [Streptomyces sp. NPDC057136]|uniref:hypothetical protein n=1 Tax=Streptomyces sp. NPDC057136 TaxID=3346029 RepID=UPI0036443517
MPGRVWPAPPRTRWTCGSTRASSRSTRTRSASSSTVVEEDGGRYVLAKPLADGSVAVALYNENEYAATISTTAAAAGVRDAGSYTLHDLLEDRSVSSNGTIQSAVPGHGVSVYTVRPSREGDTTSTPPPRRASWA